MQYHGGKARQAKQIGAYLKTLGNGRYYEPFVGGGSVLAQVAEHFSEAYASDIHPDLILMYQALQQGWVPPKEVSEAEYQRLRYAEPSALRGFVGFACSFGGKWFHGYARDDPRPGRRPYAVRSQETLMTRAPGIKLANYCCQDYRSLAAMPGDVIYCDPPYLNGTSMAQSPKFNSVEFWRVMQQWVAMGAHVLVSETVAPGGWEDVLRMPTTLALGLHNDKSVRNEILFRCLAEVA
jgi:DNA adenine methylase